MRLWRHGGPGGAGHYYLVCFIDETKRNTHNYGHIQRAAQNRCDRRARPETSNSEIIYYTWLRCAFLDPNARIRFVGKCAKPNQKSLRTTTFAAAVQSLRAVYCRRNRTIRKCTIFTRVLLFQNEYSSSTTLLFRNTVACAIDMIGNNK